MNQQQTAEYAELIEKLGKLLAASYGANALEEERVDMIKEDLEVAINSELEVPVF